ncbi:MAG: hypothetical protein P9X22_06035 [Candidatus Zapsychrus exili]|nr:hypothetical protein [Candidatus Zapsychrus exili]
MAKKSKGIIVLGVLLILLGTFWLSLIYQRGKSFIPKEKQPYFKEYGVKAIDYVALGNEMKEILAESKRSSAVNVPTLDRKAIIVFWIIVCFELICAFLYLGSGISLLRFHSLARGFTIFTLLFDSFLKCAAVVYQSYILELLGQSVSKNIVFNYFAPTNGFMSKVSAYLTGVGFVQKDSLIYILSYLFCLFLCFYFLTRKSVIKQFNQ